MVRYRLVLLVGLVIGLMVACDSESATLEQPNINILYKDEFAPGATGKWQTEGDDLSKSAVLNERLVIEVDAPNTVQYATLTEPAFDDFVLEVDALPLRGGPEATYGILFRMQSPQEFYRFEITSTGLYMLEKRTANGTWVRFMEDWAPSPLIKQGVNVRNKLKIVADGGNFAFFVNDQPLVNVVDSSYLTGTIGLDAGTFGQTGWQVAFDNVIVTEP